MHREEHDGKIEDSACSVSSEGQKVGVETTEVKEVVWERRLIIQHSTFCDHVRTFAFFSQKRSLGEHKQRILSFYVHSDTHNQWCIKVAIFVSPSTLCMVNV